MTLAPFVATLGRGPGRSRSLTRNEASEAMALMLSDTAAPQAVGALLMLLRMKGETADEIAGLAGAARTALPWGTSLPGADLDWPCYAAGRTRGLPWFLLAARLVAMGGRRVLLHGWNGADAAVRSALDAAGIPLAQSAEQASVAMADHNIVYLPLEDLHPALFALLDLRRVLGLRSCVNTVCRMLNPAGAAASVQGVFHPSYRLLQADAAALLGWRNLSVIKGGGGEFERHPAKDIAAFGLHRSVPFQQTFPALNDDTGRLAEATGASLPGLWSGAETDAFARDIVTGTAALALWTLGETAPMARAEELWRTRTPLTQETAA